jgi:hypothetical protein
MLNRLSSLIAILFIGIISGVFLNTVYSYEGWPCFETFLEEQGYSVDEVSVMPVPIPYPVSDEMFLAYYDTLAWVLEEFGSHIEWEPDSVVPLPLPESASEEMLFEYIDALCMFLSRGGEVSSMPLPLPYPVSDEMFTEYDYAIKGYLGELGYGIDEAIFGPMPVPLPYPVSDEMLIEYYLDYEMFLGELGYYF